MERFVEERANSVIEMSLTELAFIFFFILLTFSVWKISDVTDQLTKKEEKVVGLNSTVTALHEEVGELKNSLENTARFFDMSKDYDPEELFRELAAGRSAVEQLKSALAEKAKLEEQLIVFNEAVGDLDSLDRLSQQLAEHQRLLEIFQKSGLGEDAHPELIVTELVQNNIDLKGQNINLREKLKAIGNGLDHPPCWADPDTGSIQYVFNVIIKENSVVFESGWPSSRADQASSNRNITQVVGEYKRNQNMWKKTEALFRESERNQCRHFVRIYDHSESKAAFKKYLLGVENHFYKFLSSKRYL